MNTEDKNPENRKYRIFDVTWTCPWALTPATTAASRPPSWPRCATDFIIELKGVPVEIKKRDFPEMV